VSKEGKREIELRIGEGSLAMTGIFDIRFWEAFKKRLPCGR